MSSVRVHSRVTGFFHVYFDGIVITAIHRIWDKGYVLAKGDGNLGSRPEYKVQKTVPEIFKIEFGIFFSVNTIYKTNFKPI